MPGVIQIDDDQGTFGAKNTSDLLWTIQGYKILCCTVSCSTLYYSTNKKK